MIELIGTVVLFGIIALAALIPAIVFLDRNAAHRTAQALAVVAVVAVCVVLGGIAVLVIADVSAKGVAR